MEGKSVGQADSFLGTFGQQVPGRLCLLHVVEAARPG